MSAIYVMLVGAAAIPVLVALLAGLGWLLADGSYIRDWGDYVAEGLMTVIFGLLVLGVVAVLSFVVGFAILRVGQLLSLWQLGWLT